MSTFLIVIIVMGYFAIGFISSAISYGISDDADLSYFIFFLWPVVLTLFAILKVGYKAFLFVAEKARDIYFGHRK